MIILAVQSVIVPVLLSFLVQTSHQRFTFLRGKLTLLFILLWLFVYAWIIQLPHIPPKQALDWIGIFSLLTVLPFLKLAVHHQWVKSYLLIVGCLFFITSTWPVISYDASFSSHKLIWAEISALYIWFAVVLVREINVNGATYKYFNLAFSL